MQEDRSRAPHTPQIPRLDRFAEIFDLARLAKAPVGTVLRIELEPEDSSLRYWAVVSATDNRTNAVKFFVPR